MTFNPFKLRKLVAEARREAEKKFDASLKARLSLRKILSLYPDDEQIKKLVSEGLGDFIYSNEIAAATITADKIIATGGIIHADKIIAPSVNDFYRAGEHIIPRDRKLPPVEKAKPIDVNITVSTDQAARNTLAALRGLPIKKDRCCPPKATVASDDYSSEALAKLM